MTTPPLHQPALAIGTKKLLRELTDRWTNVGAVERANYQLYIVDLCKAIGVEWPRPASVGGHVADGIAYQFDLPVKTTARDGTTSTNFVDLYKAE